MPVATVRPSVPATSFLDRFPAPTRQFVRQTFAAAAEHKAEVASLMLDVKLRADMILFSPHQYRNLTESKRLLDCLRDDPQSAAEYAREVLRKGGRA